MPFGFDGFCWRLMGEGIGWMIAVALWVASLPGAVGRMAAFGIGPLLLGSAGLVVLCLLKSPLRLAGVALLALASLWAVRTPQPDVLVAADGMSFAVRGADGRLAIIRSGSDTFAVRQWLAADADARAPHRPEPGRRGSAAIGPAASAASRTAAWSRWRARSRPSRRIAAAPPWSRAARGPRALRRSGHRPQHVATDRGGDTAAYRRRVHNVGRAAGRLRSSLGAGAS